tara:strand:+ start:2681 stop:3829 length:1149 start_codon:yes stop_codon:yes gene_type:complete
MAKLNKIMPPRNTTIRGQDHLLAYITPDEAQLLKDNGGSGEAGPMGIPTFIDPGAGANNAGSGVGPDNASQDVEDSYGVAGGSTSGFGFGDLIGGYLSSGPIGIVGDFLDSTVGLQAHDPGAGGGTEGDGPDFSAISRFYGGGGGPSANSCPEGYIYDEQLGACRLNTRPDMVVPTDGGLLRSAPSGGYARMGLLDVAPTGLPDFAERYGISGYASPSAFDEQNLAFRRQGATYPEFFKNPPLLPGYTNLETVAGLPNQDYYVGPALAPTAQAPASSNPFMVGGERLTPAGAIVANIAGLGNDDPLIQRANEMMGPAGDPWERALNIAAQLPPPPGVSKGQYLAGLAETGQRLGIVGTPIQDDAGGTIGYQSFMHPEGGDAN